MNKPEYIGQADWLLLNKKYNNNIPSNIEELIKNNYPIQYIIGDVEFLNSIIKVRENVLIPRFETELLVKKTIDRFNKSNHQLKVLDIGTGTGAIAINLAKELNSLVTALDISDYAISLAKENAKLNNVDIKLLKLDILNDPIDMDYDIIISNPPYVRYDEEVDERTKYEPSLALYANDNGLEFYKKIIELSKKNKQENFYLIFEIGSEQAEDISNFLKLNFRNVKIEIENDYSNRNRYIFATVQNNE